MKLTNQNVQMVHNQCQDCTCTKTTQFNYEELFFCLHNDRMHNQDFYTIDHLHASPKECINNLIAVTSRLDAVDALRNVLRPMGFQLISTF